MSKKSKHHSTRLYALRVQDGFTVIGYARREDFKKGGFIRVTGYTIVPTKYLVSESLSNPLSVRLGFGEVARKAYSQFPQSDDPMKIPLNSLTGKVLLKGL